ncbi:alpha/beta hydrolase [Nocardioides speluncae]|uniref:alpha/beta hydrolase n=1 Tax=Nocardioides speluncae TaxID=2670337 RepID=UPI000D69722B|nr:alpha/beta fold hydrolase [Nocardioides speluncae]
MNLRLVFAAGALLLVAACGGDADDPNGSAADPSSPTTAPTDPTTAQPREPVAERCPATLAPDFAPAEPTAVTFKTEDGVELYGAELGSGPKGVVLVPGTSSDGLCNWAMVAAALAKDGFHVLAIDSRCQGDSGCNLDNEFALDVDVVAAVAELRERGATTVTAVGESRGGAVVLAAAARPDFNGDAVVPVSGVWFDGLYSGPDPAPLAGLVGRIKVPVLYLSTQGDTDQAEYRGFAKATAKAEYVAYDGADHGASMFGSQEVEPQYRKDFLRFLSSVAR